MDIHNVINKKWVQLSSVAVVAFAGGSLGGYILGKRHGTKEVIEESKVIQMTLPFTATEEQQERIIEKVLDDEQIDHYTRRTVEIETQEPTTQLEDEQDEEEMQTNAVSRVNVFMANDEDDWDWEMELQSRHSRVPYVIHQEEFVEDSMGYRQETLTYYEGDDIVADATDTPIYNYQNLMGELKFGHGSKDRNVVYIRNEEIHMEWEILRSEGMFSVEVLGMEADKEAEEEIRHSYRAPHKFRRSD